MNTQAWIITDEQHEALVGWIVDDRPALQGSTERADMAEIIVGMYYDGLFTFNEMRVSLDKLYGRQN